MLSISLPVSSDTSIRCGMYGWSRAYVSIRQHTSAYVSIRQLAGVERHEHPLRYVRLVESIRQHASAYVSIRQRTCVERHEHPLRHVRLVDALLLRQYLYSGTSKTSKLMPVSRDASIRCRVRLVESIRQHTSAYVCRGTHPLPYVRLVDALEERQYLYSCTSKASKLNTCSMPSMRSRRRFRVAHALVYLLHALVYLLYWYKSTNTDTCAASAWQQRRFRVAAEAARHFYML